MNIEDELGGLLDAAVRGVLADADEEAVLRGGHALGLRLRRRRRTIFACTAVAAVLVLSGGVAAGVEGLSGGRAVGASPASGSATGGNATGGTVQSGPPSQAASTTRTATYQPESIMSVLRKLAPAGNKISESPYVPAQVNTDSFTSLEDNDGHGAVDVDVSVAWTEDDSMSTTCSSPLPNEGARPAGALPQSCATVTLPGGDRALELVTACDNYGFYDIQVNMVRSDGISVSLDVTNGQTGTINPPVRVTRAVPPLSIGQVAKMAEDPLWEAVLVGTTPGSSPSAPAPIQITSAGALTLLQGLLPSGHLAATPEQSGGNALLDAFDTDGAGPAEVQVFVDPAAHSGIDPVWCAPTLPPDNGKRPAGAAPQSCTVKTLPNGDKAMLQVTSTDANGYYSYRIIVDQKAGFDVEIEVTNGSYDYTVKPVLARPPLTLNQWAAIADNPGWH